MASSGRVMVIGEFRSEKLYTCVWFCILDPLPDEAVTFISVIFVVGLSTFTTKFVSLVSEVELELELSCAELSGAAILNDSR